ncbi:MAG: DUF2459 domain-containing protein, partial [Phreatobacter sp.]
MTWLRRCLRAAALGMACLTAAIIVLTVVSARRADPALYPPRPDQPSTLVHVVSHGWHSGIALSREALKASADRQGLGRLAAILDRFSAFPTLEIGWGDERFYQETPTVADVRVMSALRALFQPGNAAVLHVVGLDRPAPQVFRRSDILGIRLSEPGLDRLARYVDASIAADAEGRPREIGQGLYGPSLFYAATGVFSVLQVCNHWVGRGLAEAGLPYAWLPAIHPKGLFADLQWRAGAAVLASP